MRDRWQAAADDMVQRSTNRLRWTLWMKGLNKLSLLKRVDDQLARGQADYKLRARPLFHDNAQFMVNEMLDPNQQRAQHRFRRHTGGPLGELAAKAEAAKQVLNDLESEQDKVKQQMDDSDKGAHRLDPISMHHGSLDALVEELSAKQRWKQQQQQQRQPLGERANQAATMQLTNFDQAHAKIRLGLVPMAQEKPLPLDGINFANYAALINSTIWRHPGQGVQVDPELLAQAIADQTLKSGHSSPASIYDDQHERAWSQGFKNDPIAQRVHYSNSIPTQWSPTPGLTTRLAYYLAQRIEWKRNSLAHKLQRTLSAPWASRPATASYLRRQALLRPRVTYWATSTN